MPPPCFIVHLPTPARMSGTSSFADLTRITPRLSRDFLDLPTPSSLMEVFRKSLMQRGPRGRMRFVIAQPGGSLKRLHWPNLLGSDYMGFKDKTGGKILPGPNLVCPQ